MIADTQLANGADSGTVLIRLNPAFRALMVVCGLAIAIFAMWAMVFMSTGTCGPAATAICFAICPFMLGIGAYCVWTVMRFAVIVSDDGIRYRSWHDWRFAKWADITELKYRVIDLVLRTRDGRKFEVAIFITDLKQFLSACKQHLPGEIVPPEALAKLENPSNMRCVWFAMQMVLMFAGLSFGETIGAQGPGLGRANGEDLGRLLGSEAALAIALLIEAAVSWRWPAFKSPPIFTRPTPADAQPQGPARQAIASALFGLVWFGTMVAGLAVTGSLGGGLVAPFLALFVLIAVAWALTKIKNRRREASCP